MPARPPTHGQDLRRLRNAEREKTATRRLYDRKWAEYSKLFRTQHPLCADPFGEHKGRVVAAAVVDHIEPHKGDALKFWNPRNHQSLCLTCHSRKTVSEDGGFGRVGS